ncbi:MAG: TIGR03118 family protein [Candidatus Acidiferrum sp.]
MNSSKLRNRLGTASLTLLLAPLCFAQEYIQTNLVSNVPVIPAAVVTDPNLQNAWGLVHGPGTPWWISNNASGISTLYNTSGLNPLNPSAQSPTPVLSPVTIVPLNAPGGMPGNGVKIPNAPSQPAPGSPTSAIFNGAASDFLLASGAPAVFIFVTEDGTVQGWNPSVNATTAIIKVDNSQMPNKNKGAVYKGATIAEINGKEFLLAANFRNGRIDVFDSNFQQVRISEELFDDDEIPRDFAPFNVQGIGPNIYVTYAKQDAAKHDPVGGAGLGYVVIFSPDGRKLAHLQHGDWFNAPWGVVLAPADFGEFSHTILVGNFRGATIAAFNPLTGKFIGNMLDSNSAVVNIDGLWALVFGNGGASGPGSTLFFTAGPDNETNGLFGTLTPVSAQLQEDDEQ